MNTFYSVIKVNKEGMCGIPLDEAKTINEIGTNNDAPVCAVTGTFIWVTTRTGYITELMGDDSKLWTSCPCYCIS